MIVRGIELIPLTNIPLTNLYESSRFMASMRCKILNWRLSMSRRTERGIYAASAHLRNRTLKRHQCRAPVHGPNAQFGNRGGSLSMNFRPAAARQPAAQFHFHSKEILSSGPKRVTG